MKSFKSVDEMMTHMEEEKRKHPIKNFFFTFRCKLEKWFIDNPQDFCREVKWFIQKGIRGWADKDTWDFDNYISTVIQNALLHFKKNKNGYPHNLTEEEWNEILNKIIYSFHTATLISNGAYFYLNTQENKLEDYIKAKEQMKGLDYLVVMSWDDCKRYEEGLRLFTKHLHSLWD